MTNLIRSAFVRLGYKALTVGIRIPSFRMAAEFSQQSYLIDLTRRLGINVFLDVGANRGFFSKHLRMAGYRGNIFSFEPIPEDHDHIKTLAANDASWRTYCYALGAESGQKEFQINLSGDETVLSSFLPLKEPSSNTRSVVVAMRRLDEVLPELIAGIQSPRIFLKMDTQGFDNQVIEGAAGCLHQILGVQSEISVIPLYNGMLHYTESLLQYERLGFSLMNLFVVNRTGDGLVLEYDCLLARANALLRR